MLSRRGLGGFVGGCAVCAALALSSKSSALAGTGAGESIEGSGYRLWFVGGMRETVMMGKREAALDLRTLRDQPHLYGVGPTDGLTGEVTISDSRPSLARVGADNRIHVSESFDAGGPFFVWAEVPVWKELPVPDQVRTYDDLDLFVGKAGKDLGLTQAFPFLVAGRIHFIDFHVVNAKPNTPAGMAGHAAIQIPLSQRFDHLSAHSSSIASTRSG